MLGIVGAALVFMLDISAGIVCTITIVCVYITITAYIHASNNKARSLSALLQHINAVEGNLALIDSEEGAKGILKDDIYKLVARTNEYADVINRERAKAEDALADISHQLKTPLASLSISIDILQSSDLTTKQREKFVSDMRVALTRMEWMVQSLLAFARLDSGTIKFKRETVNAADIAREAASAVAMITELHDQSLMCSGDDNVALECDRRWTVEAITNILKNASEHSGDGTTIYLTYGQNPLSTWFGVTDEGAGIKLADMGALFKRYAQTNNKGGAGIGLPLAMSIAKAQNGTIDVDPGGNGKGATFTLKLFK
ncbi:MAG: HAMP domain-containing histidine kinase [Coriobacteriales bacterium]|nr:HAMP domain-containing histidine kinase [Coriobacteriales bacterium]